jgi:ribonuclease-3
MTPQEVEEIEKTIGYRFSNQTLLKQAFTRKSYTAERGGQNNEVLEFLGDKVIGFIVTKKMPGWYGKINADHEFESRLQEGQLTEIEKKLVFKDTLAKRIDILCLNQYLIMGKGDIKKHAEEDVSVKEDTFEALVGAVAIDSGYDMKKLEEVVLGMLDPEFYLNEGFDADENFTSELQEWFLKKGYGLPQYEFDDRFSYFAGTGFGCSLVIPEINKRFTADGPSKTKARLAVAKSVLTYLDDQGLLADPNDVVTNPNENDAIAQLYQLYQHGFISEPEYVAEEQRDKGGSIVWHVEVHVKELEKYWQGDYTSKKEGRRNLAYRTLLDVLGKPQEDGK